MITRRHFVGLSVSAGGALALAGCKCPFCGPRERVPYGDTIGDRLWMWGHHRDSFKALKGTKEQYNLPFDTRIDMAAACGRMSIPGCFVVRWTNNPKKAELPEYMKQFRDMRRLGFSITDGAVETFEEKIRIGLEYADRMPNLSHFVMDDFWSGAGKGVTTERIRRLRAELAMRGMKLCVVLYSDANGIKAEQKEILDLCDEVTLWFWHGKNTGGIEERVGKLRELIGNEKPVLLGQYMYDFGGGKVMPGATMGNQLAQTSRLLAAKAISGVIFHCTPLVDMDLDAVRVSKAWIVENAARKWGA